MKNSKKFSLFLAFFFAFFTACEESDVTSANVPETIFASIAFENGTVKAVNPQTKTIAISLNENVDSLQLKSITSNATAEFYLTTDADLIDPGIGQEMQPGIQIAVSDTNSFSFVVLDEKKRIVEVWLVKWETEKSSSSESSSSAEKEKSSSSEKISSAKESSSSMSSSSSKIKNSSAEIISSSSVEISSSSEKSSSSFSSSEVSSSSETEISSSEIFSSSSILKTEIPQIPGSDFSSRNDFFATTSDAMATEGSATVVAKYTFKSEANLIENGSSIILSTEEVSCAWGGIPGGWKMATGIYFTGEYSGTDARDIYDEGYESGTPSTAPSDLTKKMKFGKPYTARPTAFELTYSYEHVANKSKEFPQKSLAYVILVSADNHAVALGMLSDSATVEQTMKIVRLNYGADPDGILSAGYAGTSDLTLGTGDEEVASIRVLFASSAYAHIVAGGVAGKSSDFRGGEKSSLTLENFRLLGKEVAE